MPTDRAQQHVSRHQTQRSRGGHADPLQRDLPYRGSYALKIVRHSLPVDQSRSRHHLSNDTDGLRDPGATGARPPHRNMQTSHPHAAVRSHRTFTSAVARLFHIHPPAHTPLSQHCSEFSIGRQYSDRQPAGSTSFCPPRHSADREGRLRARILVLSSFGLAVIAALVQIGQADAGASSTGFP